MTNSFKFRLGRWGAGLCAALVFTACSMPSLPFGSTPTPRPIEVTLFFTPPSAETPTREPTPQPDPATATSAPTATPLVLPTTAPTELPIVVSAATGTPLPTAPPTPLPVVEVAAPRVVTVIVTVTVIATAPPVSATPRLTATALRTSGTATPTLSAKSISSTSTPTRVPTRPRPTAVPVVAAAPANLSGVLFVVYKSNLKSDPWGMPFNDDGCTQFDDRRPARKVYLELIVRPLVAGVNSWNAQFYLGGNPFPTCISDPFIQHGTLRERDIPAQGYPLAFDISKTLIAFVPEGQSVTRLNLFANGKAELCFALSGASANEIPCGS